MSDYYEKDRGCAFHPGGWTLTEKAVKACAFPSGARICDMGSGEGDTVKKLRALGYDAVGVEPSAEMDAGGCAVRAAAEDTGFDAESFDGVLFECVLSLCEDPACALKEAARILKRGGKLVLSDLCSDNGGECSGIARHIFRRDAIASMLACAGFTVLQENDCTHELTTFALQLIMDGAADEICEELKYLRGIKAGYFMTIAEKE